MTQFITCDQTIKYKSLRQKEQIVQDFINKGFDCGLPEEDNFFMVIDIGRVCIRMRVVKDENFGKVISMPDISFYKEKGIDIVKNVNRGRLTHPSSEYLITLAHELIKLKEGGRELQESFDILKTLFIDKEVLQVEQD